MIQIIMRWGRVISTQLDSTQKLNYIGGYNKTKQKDIFKNNNNPN